MDRPPPAPASPGIKPPPGRAAQPPGAPLPKPPRLSPVSGRKREIASSLRKMARETDETHPEMMTGTHLRDAARVLEGGRTHGAIRHLQTAAHGLTPQSLYRHGIMTDDGHTAARRQTYGVTRHILLIKDVQDQEADNLAKITRTGSETSSAQSGADNTGRPVLTAQPVTRGPFGPAAVNAPSGPLPTGGSRGVAAAAGPGPAVRLATELSAQTARLAVTPAPRGRPGGPGLYDVKGMGHTPYLQNVVKALIRKGMDPGRAYAVARASIRKWRGSKHPEVAAAAGQAEAGEVARQSAAKGAHGHTADCWACVIELVGTTAGAAKDSRTPAGQFGTAGQGGKPQQGAQGGKSAQAARARQKAQLLATAKLDRQKAAQLTQQLAALTKTSKKVAKKTAQATKAGATGKAAASTPAKRAAPAKPGARKPGAKHLTKAQQITALRKQIATLLAQAATATAQAAKL